MKKLLILLLLGSSLYCTDKEEKDSPLKPILVYTKKREAPDEPKPGLYQAHLEKPRDILRKRTLLKDNKVVLKIKRVRFKDESN